MEKGIDKYVSHVQRRSFSRSELVEFGCLNFSSGFVGIDDVGDILGSVRYPTCRWVEYCKSRHSDNVFIFDDYIFRDIYVFGLHKLRRYFASYDTDGNELVGSRGWILEFLN